MEWAQKSGSCIYDGLLLKLYEKRTGQSKREMNSIDRSLYCKDAHILQYLLAL